MPSCPHLYLQLCLSGGCKLWNPFHADAHSVALCCSLFSFSIASLLQVSPCCFRRYSTFRSAFTACRAGSITVCPRAAAVHDVRLCDLSDSQQAAPYLKEASLSLSLPADPSITLETCRQAVTELRNSLKKTAMFYSTVCVCVSLISLLSS